MCLLTGLLLFGSSLTAFSPAMAASENATPGSAGGVNPDLYNEKNLEPGVDTRKTKPGDMYLYSEIDPRFDDSEAQAKAEWMSRNASKKNEKQSFNVAENTKRVLDR
ncbi:MAG TPA: hypothetical protein V6D19_17635 [Stenomitos sp.]